MSTAATKHEWLFLWQATERLKEKTGLEISNSTWRRWREKGKCGIVFGKFGGRITIRADTIPNVIEDD